MIREPLSVVATDNNKSVQGVQIERIAVEFVSVVYKNNSPDDLNDFVVAVGVADGDNFVLQLVPPTVGNKLQNLLKALRLQKTK